MHRVDLCEAVSAATHGLACLAALPLLVSLRRSSRWDGGRRASLSIYGLGLLACFASSANCHAQAAAGRSSRNAVLLDHMAIFLLIAGTYTPIARHLLRPRWRRMATILSWSAAVVGITLNLLRGPLPAWAATSIFLVLGWLGLLCYFGMRHDLTHRQLRLIPIGGLLYSIGAACHVSHWPVVWPGVVGPHEVFHLFVVAGAAAHFRFLAERVAARPLPAAVPTVPARPRPATSMVAV